jgi:hypothetical protein
MRTSKFLRAASAVAAVQFLAHALMFALYKPVHGPEETAVVESMKSHVFIFGGFHRSYWDMYFGYGLLGALNCLVEAVCFWQLAAIARGEVSIVRPMAILFIVANGVHALLCLRYFFLTPVVPDVVVIVCLGVACLGSHAPRTISARSGAPVQT